VITDARPGRDPLAVARAAVAAARRLGAGPALAVQVRVEDDASDRSAYELTMAVLQHTRPIGATCLVNDRLHVAVAAGADGGHVGADDLPVDAARRVLGAAAILGATCRDADDARAAVAAGASYLGVGPCFTTGTKQGLPDPIGVPGVAAVARAAPGIPVVAIGGVTGAAVPALRDAGAHGVAVVGAVASAADPERAAAELLLAVLAAAPLTGAAIEAVAR
jgi:thiamine-phosphate pyrophosphorylase